MTIWWMAVSPVITAVMYISKSKTGNDLVKLNLVQETQTNISELLVPVVDTRKFEVSDIYILYINTVIQQGCITLLKMTVNNFIISSFKFYLSHTQLYRDV